MSDTHTNTTAKSKELLLMVVLAFLVPIVGVVAVVYYTKSSTSKVVVASANSERAMSERIQKVGSVAVREAARELQTGEQVFNAQCSACHGTGAMGSPKFGDAAAWGPRIKTGFSALLNSALKGKNAMSPQGGGQFSDFEIARAVTYMANAGGAKFPEPKEPSQSGAAN